MYDCICIHVWACVCVCVRVPARVRYLYATLCVYLSEGIMDPHGPVLAVYELQREELIHNRSTLNYHLLSHLGFCSLFPNCQKWLSFFHCFPSPFHALFLKKKKKKVPFVKPHKDCLIVWKSKIVSQTRVNRAKVQMGELALLGCTEIKSSLVSTSFYTWQTHVMFLFFVILGSLPVLEISCLATLWKFHKCYS